MGMDVTAPAKRRAKLFRRTETPRGMELTARDLTLLAHVARLRILTSAQLARLDGGSAQGVLRCLRSLFDHGFLDRPRSQTATLLDQGPAPLAYALGQKGARALREYGHRINNGVDWTEKNKRAGSFFLNHTIEIADFMIGVELACRAQGNIHIIREEQIIAAAPVETQSAREPLRWEAVSIERGKRERWSAVPDGLFGLTFADETAAYFLLECDRGSIPITRSVGDHRSFRRKLKTYYDGWRAQRHLKQFGVKQMRVLTITSSQERMHNMVGAVRSITEGRGSNFFLFVDRETLAASDPLSVEWVSGKGERVRLTD
jgi:hypothetical protein